MKLSMLCIDIHNRIKSGEIYQSIADSYGISKAMVWQIEHGYHPGKKVSGILGLDPCPDLKYTRARRKRLNEIAQAWGFSSWSAYETHILDTCKR